MLRAIQFEADDVAFFYGKRFGQGQKHLGPVSLFFQRRGRKPLFAEARFKPAQPAMTISVLLHLNFNPAVAGGFGCCFKIHFQQISRLCQERGFPFSRTIMKKSIGSIIT